MCVLLRINFGPFDCQLTYFYRYCMSFCMNMCLLCLTSSFPHCYPGFDEYTTSHLPDLIDPHTPTFGDAWAMRISVHCFFHFLPLPAVSWPEAVQGLRTSEFHYMEWKSNQCKFHFHTPMSHFFICFNTRYTLSLEGQNAYLCFAWCRFS